MEKWVACAFVSMFFAGFTSVITKMGLAGISGELGLTIRTLPCACSLVRLRSVLGCLLSPRSSGKRV
jgi:transporter family protein